METGFSIRDQRLVMILIEFQSPEPAQMLADYLSSKNLKCNIEIREHSYALVLLDSSQLAKAEAELSLFLQEPNHPRYRAVSWEHSRPSTIENSQDNLWTELFLQAQPFTTIIFLGCILIFIGQKFVPQIYSWLWFEWPSVNGQIWRILTPAFLHFSWLHLIFNLAWWWYLGSKIEIRYQASKLLMLFIVAGIIPNLLQAIFVGPDFGGLSGVTYSLLSYLWWRERHLPTDEKSVSDGLLIFMGVWVLLGFIGVLDLQAANYAHLGGLIIGLIQAWRDKRKITPA